MFWNYLLLKKICTTDLVSHSWLLASGDCVQGPLSPLTPVRSPNSWAEIITNSSVWRKAWWWRSCSFQEQDFLKFPYLCSCQPLHHRLVGPNQHQLLQQHLYQCQCPFMISKNSTSSPSLKRNSPILPVMINLLRSLKSKASWTSWSQSQSVCSMSVHPETG